MKNSIRLAGIGFACAAAALLFAGPAGASEARPASHPHQSHAVFVQTDNPAGNAVVAYRRDDHGALTQTETYPTGGVGGVLAGSEVDHLASQGSLVLDQAAGRLYAVNAGSNSLTVFAVNGDHLRRLQVISSGGTFPVSVAVHDHLVYVANALAGGSIQGYVRVGDRLVTVPSWHRDLGLDPALTPQFVNTPGQVAFTPDGEHLIVTTKANGNNIDVFGVDRFGGPSTSPVVTNLPGAVPFAIDFDRAGHLVIAEAGPSAVATFSVRRHGNLTALSTVATGQKATCWVEAIGNRVYASNAGSGNVTAVRSGRHSGLSLLGNTATDGGTVDAAASSDGKYLYVQTGANGIVDAFAVGPDGTLTAVGSVTVPGSVGGEGIAAA